jgi:hypothetical protein
MRIKTVYYPEPQEVDVSIGTDEINAALNEQLDSLNSIFMFLNSMAQTCRAISNEHIKKMTDSQKKTIQEFFQEQAGRYENNNK